jgi:hypothetical protein
MVADNHLQGATMRISRSRPILLRIAYASLIGLVISCEGLMIPETAELKVTEPTTGDHWQVGLKDAAIIVWTNVDAFGPIRIDLYKGSDFHTNIATGVRVIDEQYIWTVPGSVEPDRGYQIYIHSEWDSTLFAFGKAFEIDPYETESVLDVVAPQSRDKWQSGLQDGGVIRWGYENLSGAVKIVLYDAADPMITIADSVNLSDSTYFWTVALAVPAGRDYRIYLESLADSYVGAFSESFEIIPSDTPSLVELSTPGSDARWQIGLVNAAVVEWTYTNLSGTMRIDLYHEGLLVTNIADSIDVADESFRWTVPLTVTADRNYQIYLESNSLPFVNDLGGSFRIDPFDSEPRLEVASPGRDDIWVLGQTNNALIEWIYANVGGTIRIDLYDGRSYYGTIADSIDVTDGEYTWTVPDSIPVGTRYNLNLVSNELPTLIGYGDNFSIQDLASVAILEVTSPISGDFWLLGMEDGAVVQWYSEYLTGTIQIDLYDGRTLVSTLGDNVDIALGSLTWTVPESMPTGKQYSIVLTSNALPSLTGESASFSILDLASVAVLELTGPAADDIWIIGETGGADINWYWEYLIGTLRIDLYDHRTFVTTIADNVEIEQGGYTWTVPESFPAGTRYNLRLVSNELPEIEASSDNFNILDLASVAVVAVTRPGTGDVWIKEEADRAFIQWHRQYLTGTIRIDLYNDRTLALTIADDISILDGSYTWTVPDSLPNGTYYSVMLTSNELLEIQSQGADFTIADSASVASLEVVRPDVEDAWIIGEPDGAQVEWNSEYLSGTVKIDLYDGPKYETTIAEGVNAAERIYLWTVPASISAGKGYTISLQSNNLPGVSDVSESFSILDSADVAVLEITNPGASTIWTIGEENGALLEWNSHYLTGTIKIDLYNGNTLVTTIADGIDVSAGSYTWTVPLTVTGGIRYNVRLQSDHFPGVGTQSENFTIQ